MITAPEGVLDLAWRLWSRSTPSSKEAVSAAARDNHEERASKLRSFLRRFPYWRRGHVLLADTSLLLDDIATAYASAQVVLILSSPATRHQALLRLGQCHLRRGDTSGALRYFAELNTENFSLSAERDVFLEEHAAAYMALGDKEQARGLLAAIPDERRSPQAHAAWSYLTRT